MVMGAVSVVMARRDSDLPRQVVVAVTAGRVTLFALSRAGNGLGPDVASWDRTYVKASAERTARGWELWVQPPGDRAGFELRAPTGPATDAVVAALARA